MEMRCVCDACGSLFPLTSVKVCPRCDSCAVRRVDAAEACVTGRPRVEVEQAVVDLARWARSSGVAVVYEEVWKPYLELADAIAKAWS